MNNSYHGCKRCGNLDCISLKPTGWGSQQYHINDNIPYINYIPAHKKYDSTTKLCKKCIDYIFECGFFYFFSQFRCQICENHPSFDTSHNVIFSINSSKIVRAFGINELIFSDIEFCDSWACNSHIHESEYFNREMTNLYILPRELIQLINGYIIKFRKLIYECFKCRNKYYCNANHPVLDIAKNGPRWQNRKITDEYIILDSSPEYWNEDFTGLCNKCK